MSEERLCTLTLEARSIMCQALPITLYCGLVGVGTRVRLNFASNFLTKPTPDFRLLTVAAELRE